MARSTVFQLFVKACLHLGPLQEHLLPDLVDCLLVLDGHGVSDTTYFFPCLYKLSLNVVSLVLAVG